RLILEDDNAETGRLESFACSRSAEQKADRSVARPRHRKMQRPGAGSDDVGKAVAASAFEHAPDLAIESVAIFDVHRHGLRPDDIKAALGERDSECVALTILHLVGEPGARGQHCGCLTELRRQVEARDATAVGFCDVAGRSADAATEVEQSLIALEREEAGEI